MTNQMENRIMKTAAQVYSVREEAARDFEAAMTRLRGYGYQGVELAGLYGHSPEYVRDVLQKLGLEAVSAHVGFADFESDEKMAQTVGTYKVVGCRYLGISYLPPERLPGGAQYAETLAQMKKFASLCRGEGITLMYHNHTGEFAKTASGAYVLDALYGDTAADELTAEFDLGWVKAAGEDPAAYLAKYAGRCPVVHMKDFTGSGEKAVLLALGEGVQDIPALVQAARQADVRWLVVEQDDHSRGTPMHNMQISLEALEKELCRKLRVAVVGCGGIANGKHLPAMKRNGHFEIVAFCDLIEERAQKAKEEYGTPASRIYTDYKELLEKEQDIEAVYVLTPNNAHAPVSIAAMEAGRNVMCEKPMAKTYAEAKAMVETAERTGKLLTIGYQGRYRADSSYLKSACQDGELGEIYYARAHAIRRRAVPTWGVFTDEEKQGGGPLIDIGTHALDLTLWMMNNYEPEMVVGSVYRKLADQVNTGNAWGDWDPEQYTVEDSAFGFIRMKNGATINLEASWALNSLDVRESQTTLCGTKGGADMQKGLRLNYVKHGRQCVEEPDLNAGGVAFFDGASEKPDDVEQRVFYNAIVRGEPLTVQPRQAMVVTQILEAIYEAGRTGKPVYF